MDDEAVRKRVQERMADGRLPRHIPIRAKPVEPGQRPETALVVGSAFRNPCVVCDVARTQVRYNASTGSIAFHQRCHQIWTEEVGRLLRVRRIALCHADPSKWLATQHPPTGREEEMG